MMKAAVAVPSLLISFLFASPADGNPGFKPNQTAAIGPMVAAAAFDFISDGEEPRHEGAGLVGGFLEYRFETRKDFRWSIAGQGMGGEDGEKAVMVEAGFTLGSRPNAAVGPTIGYCMAWWPRSVGPMPIQQGPNIGIRFDVFLGDYWSFIPSIKYGGWKDAGLYFVGMRLSRDLAF